MGTVTPILDTLLTQVLGKRAGLASFTSAQTYSALARADRPSIVRDATGQEAKEDQAQKRLHGRQGPQGRSANTRSTQAAVRTALALGQTAAGSKGASNTSAQSHFSPAARAISVVLSQVPTAPMTVTHTPLFSGQGMLLAHALAPALAQQVASSGVFYESHLLKWFGGKLDTKQMRQEPQGKLGPLSSNSSRGDAATQARGQAGSQNAAQSGQANQSSSSGGAQASAVSAESGAPNAASQTGSAQGTVHESLNPIVRQQLDVLVNSVFRWEGVPWPGAEMQWEVEEHEPSEEGEGGEHKSYATRIRLQLPTLGTLEVRMSMLQKTIYMFAWAESSESVTKMQPETEALQTRLKSIGFEAASVHLLTDRAGAADEQE